MRVTRQRQSGVYLCQAPGGIIVYGSGCETEGLLLDGMPTSGLSWRGGGGGRQYHIKRGTNSKTKHYLPGVESHC